MRKLLNRIVNYAKTKPILEDAFKYNRLYYRKVLDLLGKVEEMDLDKRRELRQELLSRTLEWSNKCGTGDGRTLKEWPLLEKETIRAHPDVYRNRNVFAIPAATGGTTGVPIQLWRSLQCIAAEQAFIDKLLVPGWPPFRKARVAVLRGDFIKDPSEKSPPFGYQAHGGQRLMLSAQHITEQSAKWYAEALNSYRPDFLYAYPSACESLAKYIINLDIYCAVPMVLTSSEVFSSGGRICVAQAFRAKTIDYYGLGERVCSASSTKLDVYHFNPAYGYVELRRISGEIKPGVSSAEVIATGFWNKAMPLVRFRTGDEIVIPSNYSHTDLEAVALGIKPFIGVLGRDSDVIKTPDGRVLIAINHLPRGTKNIVRMQIIQEQLDSVVIKIVTDLDFTDNDLLTLKNNVSQKIPEDISVDIICVEELEQLPSGKVPFIIHRLDDSMKGM